MFSSPSMDKRYWGGLLEAQYYSQQHISFCNVFSPDLASLERVCFFYSGAALMYDLTWPQDRYWSDKHII